MSNIVSNLRIILAAISIGLAIALASCATPPPIPDAEPRFDPKAVDNAFPESEYPVMSRRLWEQGNVIIAVLVQKDGSVGEVRLIESSGFPRLDDAALEWYRHHGGFLPGASKGQTIAAWKTLRVVFKLRKPEES